jgi:hypothetical protein
MKLFSLVVATSCLAASAFGVSPVTKSIAVTKDSDVQGITSPLRKDTAFVRSPLFRDAMATRGGAFPGWAAYNEALDKNPLPTKALTSLVGWALGDILAQVRGMEDQNLDKIIWTDMNDTQMMNEAIRV